MYQLLKTSIPLASAARLDVVVNGLNSNSLEIEDINLVNMNHPQYSFRNLLGSSHALNIKKLYSSNATSFFSHTHSVEFSGPCYLYSNKYVKDTHESKYEMGIRRVKNIYNKDLEVFVPLWITSQEDLDFRIKISASSPNEGNILKTKVFEIKDNPTLYTYLYNYYEGVDENMMRLDLSKGTCLLKGVSAEYGIDVNRDVSYVVTNLLSQERPLLEFDNMLLSTWGSAKTLCKQMLNLAFFINVADVIDDAYITNMQNQMFCVEVNVDKKVDGEWVEVEKKDLYSNYTNIPKYDSSENKYNTGYNVLDYKSDYNLIDTIYTNRMIQSTFHWALKSNIDFTFNLYDGFAPLNEDGESIGGLFFDMPDIYTLEYKSHRNNIGWCTKINNFIAANRNTIAANIYSYLLELNEGDITKFNTRWVNKLQYDESLLPSDVSACILGVNKMDNLDNIEVLVYGGTTSSDSSYSSSTSGNITYVFTYNSGNETEMYNYLTFKYINDYILTSDKYTFWELSNDTSTLIEDDAAHRDNISKIMKAVVKPLFISYTDTITPSVADYPTSFSSKIAEEVEYYKTTNNSYKYLIRYDGGLHPQFIDPNDENKFNYMYYKNQFRNFSSMGDYETMLYSRYDANYPSLGYYNLSSPVQVNMSVLPDIKNKEGESIGNIERKWYNKSRILNLENEVKIVVTDVEIPDNEYIINYTFPEDKFAEYLLNFTNYENTTELKENDYFKYVYNLYKFSVDYDCVDVRNNLYTITYKYTL